MNTRIKTFVAVSLLIAIVSLTTLPAQAGIVDWFKSNKAEQDVAENGSFTQLYASFTSGDKPTTEQPSLSTNLNAVVSATSPAAGTQKKSSSYTVTVQVSAYNSEVGQTDDSPFITAKGTHVRDGIVAANVIDANGRNLPFGTIIKIPSIYGNKIFVVEDRMNKRYTKNVDIWFADKSEALKFGRRTLTIEVIK